MSKEGSTLTESEVLQQHQHLATAAAQALEQAERSARLGALGEAWLCYADHASYTQAVAARQRLANALAAEGNQPQPFPALPPKAQPFTQWLDQLQTQLASIGAGIALGSMAPQAEQD